MSHKPQLPVEVVECINNWVVTFALAYHKRKDKDISNDAAEFITDELSMPNVLTAYATKLQEVQQENESLTNQLKNYSNVSNENMKLLRQENAELRRQNDKMKDQAEGWRPLLEDILREEQNGYVDISEMLQKRIKTFLYGE